MNRPPTSNDSPDEPARDAWLSEALRHAPDADAAPSVAVRETILRQARAEAAAALATPRPVGGWQRFSAAWSWLSGPRVAAAFASVMVATVIGLIWWDRPIDDALRPVEPPAPVAAPAAAPTPAAQPAPTQAPSPPAPSAEPPRDLAAAAPPRTAPERKREGVRPRADILNDVRREAPTPPPAAPRAADEARALADAADAAESARADKAAKEIDAARERRAETLAQAKSAAPALRSAPAATAGSLQAPAPAAAPAPAPPPVAAAESRQARSAPLGALLEALAEEAPRWRWQRDGGAEQTMTPELQAWLQRVDRAAAGRWSAADPGQGSGQVQAPAQELRLLRDGGVQAIVRLGADGRVRIDISGEAPLTAQLPAAGAAALRRALDDATR